jgi:outer membrane biogenesis lipoprotein LolB
MLMPAVNCCETAATSANLSDEQQTANHKESYRALLHELVGMHLPVVAALDYCTAPSVRRYVVIAAV